MATDSFTSTITAVATPTFTLTVYRNLSSTITASGAIHAWPHVQPTLDNPITAQSVQFFDVPAT